MTSPRMTPYGSWKSPITSEMIVAETVGLGQIAIDGEDIYWIETRPVEGGRYVIRHWSPDRQAVDVTPSPFNARTLVHEYGGGSFVVAGGTIYFSNFSDQRIYHQTHVSQPRPITPEANLRYADGVIDRRRGRIICVREDHTNARGEVVNTLVSINLNGSDGCQVLVSGNDFYSSPKLSPDGSRLTWLTWNHPNMPWTQTELWVGEMMEDGSIGHTEQVAGVVNESIFQPEYSSDGTLYFVSDRNGWWNLYRWCDGRIEPLCKMEADFGVPQWIFGMSTYAFESANHIICCYAQQGIWHLASLNTQTGELEVIKTPYTSIDSLQASPGQAVFLGGSPTEFNSVIRFDLSTRKLKVLSRSSETTVDTDYLSMPQTIDFPTEQGLTAHAFFYAPKNRDYVAPPSERPPLLVMSHGGPTGAASSILNLMIQYWTSRGIAVVDVNYGGSTGYGRAYRQRLQGNWGIVDLDDCISSVRYLVAGDEVNHSQLAIRGGSAGGYTTLCALTFRNIFKAGASYFGLSDLEIFVKDTHKFESHYLDWLIGSYSEHRDLYRERSPINSIERLSCPVIFFQGLDDKIVPPNQAEIMFEALRKKGMPVAYIPFEGEQHGFRRAQNIKRALDSELYFYSKIFGFDLADPVEPVPIENL
ncbi:MAG TPA: S9 family peptidase [Dehalococcoidia bacterium]|nr:S9 family peptidase [Dehalococcoidia bacterium]